MLGKYSNSLALFQAWLSVVDMCPFHPCVATTSNADDKSYSSSGRHHWGGVAMSQGIVEHAKSGEDFI